MQDKAGHEKFSAQLSNLCKNSFLEHLYGVEILANALVTELQLELECAKESQTYLGQINKLRSQIAYQFNTWMKLANGLEFANQISKAISCLQETLNEQAAVFTELGSESTNIEWKQAFDRAASDIHAAKLMLEEAEDELQELIE